MILDENEAYILANLLMDYTDDMPEYDSAIQKLLAARKSPQDFNRSDLLLMLAAIEEYYSDTAELLTPSRDSSSLASSATSDILSMREFFA